MEDDDGFPSLFKNEHDITDDFFSLNPERIIDKRDHDVDDETKAVARSRFFAEFEHGEIARFRPCSGEVKAWLDDGLVVAIDGTDAADFEGKGACDALAVAVATLAGISPFRETVSITRVTDRKLSRLRPERDGPPEAGEEESLEQIVLSLYKAYSSRSWPTTYREYCERRRGLAETGFRARLFDGPLLTQNLATQSFAEELLSNLLGDADCLNVGVIKDTRIAEPYTRLAAMALEPGEFLVLPMRRVLQYRARAGAGGALKRHSEGRASDLLRVVYKPTVRSFALEVMAPRWTQALELALEAAQKQRGYELPYLTVAVDVRLRKLFPDAKEAARRILAADPRGVAWLAERDER